MNLLDRIFGLTTEHQDQVDKLVAIIEENEELKKAKNELEERIASLESDVVMLSEELDAERQKIQHIQEVIENSISTIKDMK